MLLHNVKLITNHILRPFNIRLETLTADSREYQRLQDLATKGHFNKPIYNSFRNFTLDYPEQLMEDVKDQRNVFKKFSDDELNSVGYNFENDYFSSPDVEILYTLIRKYLPKHIIEIGCGNSTAIMRQAISDFHSGTKITAIDPHPRKDINKLADQVYLEPVENIDANVIINGLKSNDILFIDSSHHINTGNDVFFLYCHVLPRLARGVLIHIHDIFLPYEYPADWIMDKKWGFNEQILLDILLTWSGSFDVIWPGYYIQKNKREFTDIFPFSKNRMAQSFWILKK